MKRFRTTTGMELTFDEEERIWRGSEPNQIFNAEDTGDWPFDQFGNRLEGEMDVR